jgi:hypothetical protein
MCSRGGDGEPELAQRPAAMGLVGRAPGVGEAGLCLGEHGPALQQVPARDGPAYLPCAPREGVQLAGDDREVSALERDVDAPQVRPQCDRPVPQGAAERGHPVRDIRPLGDAIPSGAYELPGPQRRRERRPVLALPGDDERLRAGGLRGIDVAEVHAHVESRPTRRDATVESTSGSRRRTAAAFVVGWIRTLRLQPLRRGLRNALDQLTVPPRPLVGGVSERAPAGRPRPSHCGPGAVSASPVGRTRGTRRRPPDWRT